MLHQTHELDQIVMEASPIQETQVPAEILIVPWGEVKSTAGSFVVDEKSAEATIAAFHEHGTDLPIDYEHQTLGGPYSSPNGLAPAAGWVKALRAVNPEQAGADKAPGIWADVEWTPETIERLRGKQYRYLSPVALVRRDDRRVVGLHSVALTNKPAIVGMPPLVNRNAPPPFDTAAAVAALRSLLSLDESATEDLIIVAAAQRIRSMQRTDELREASQRVERALSAGKLTESQREWALTLAERDPIEFDRWESVAPQLVPLGRSIKPIASNGQDTARRAAEQAARTEYRANRNFLESLCAEDAFIAAELRA